MSGKRMVKKVIGIIVAAVLVVVSVFVIKYLVDVKTYQQKVQNITFSNIDISTVPDGVYDGESDVGFIHAAVKVTVQGGKIVAIDLIKHENGKGAPAEKIIDEMIGQQSTDVDVISGATNSSKMIRKAVENALLGEK